MVFIVGQKKTYVRFEFIDSEIVKNKKIAFYVKPVDSKNIRNTLTIVKLFLAFC